MITAHRAARIYGHGADHDGGVLQVSSDGVILEVSAQAKPGDRLVDHPNAALIPGGVNVHNHSFQALLRGARNDLPFLEWRARSLYKYGADLKPDLIYLGTLLAFGEMLRSGTTTVCDFFYVHDDGLENDRAVLRADDAGHPLRHGAPFMTGTAHPASFREPIDVAIRRTQDLRDEGRKQPTAQRSTGAA